MIKTSEKDFLENDPPIRGQNYVCLSFLHPEQVLKRKDAFFFKEYIKAFVQDAKQLLEDMKEKYPDDKNVFDLALDNHQGLFGGSLDLDYQYFLEMKQEELEKRFNTENEFQTSTQGLKVRGVFESMDEAQNQCAKLRKIDNEKFNIFVAEMGCWCPWNPNPNAIKSQEFAETELNTLMSKYKDNIEDANTFYEKRKEIMKERIKEDENNKLQEREQEQEQEEAEQEQDDEDPLNDDDPWIKNKARLINEGSEEAKTDE